MCTLLCCIYINSSQLSILPRTFSSLFLYHCPCPCREGYDCTQCLEKRSTSSRHFRRKKIIFHTRTEVRTSTYITNYIIQVGWNKLYIVLLSSLGWFLWEHEKRLLESKGLKVIANSNKTNVLSKLSAFWQGCLSATVHVLLSGHILTFTCFNRNRASEKKNLLSKMLAVWKQDKTRQSNQRTISCYQQSIPKRMFLPPCKLMQCSESAQPLKHCR